MKRRYWLIVITVIVMMVVACFIIYQSPIFTTEPRRQNLANQVFLGHLVPNADGVVPVPTERSQVTTDGNIYVARDSHGVIYVLFPDERGKGLNSGGEVIASQPAVSPPPELSFYVPGVPAAGIPGGKVPFKLLYQVARGRWYYSYNLD